MNRRATLAVLLSSLFLAPLVPAHTHRLAQVEIYDRTAHRTLPIHWHDGQAYVEGRPGNEYQIVLRNPTPGDVLAVVSVDGVNVVTGQTAAPGQGGYVIEPGRQLDIAGWRKSLSRTAAFYFTELPDSYAARTGRPDDVGVIGVALFRRKSPPPVFVDPEPLVHSPSAPREKAENRSYDRLEGKRADAAPPAAAAPQLGTGHGRQEHNPARRVEFERATPMPEEILTIRYDRRENLVAMGVIRETRHAWRQPRPFPGGFVPDPPRRW